MARASHGGGGGVANNLHPLRREGGGTQAEKSRKTVKYIWQANSFPLFLFHLAFSLWFSSLTKRSHFHEINAKQYIWIKRNVIILMVDYLMERTKSVNEDCAQLDKLLDPHGLLKARLNDLKILNVLIMNVMTTMNERLSALTTMTTAG